MAFCSTCGAQIADGTTTCGACSARAGFTPVATAAPAAAPAAVPATGASGAMADNVAGMLAYITIIPAIIFLVMEPLQQAPLRALSLVSKHIFFAVALIVCWIAFTILAMVLAFIPILGHLILALLWFALAIGSFVAWIVMLLKANGGQMWKLPFIGDMAEKQANAI